MTIPTRTCHWSVCWARRF